MPVFTAIAAWVVTAIGATGMWATVASFAVRAFLTIGISKLLNRNSDSGAQATGGGRVPVNPSTENKIPVVYGTAFMAGTVIDAKISEDQKTMWYVFAMSEVTDTGTLSYDKVYWNGNEVTFDGTDHAKVVSWATNSTPPQVDDKVNGYGWIYLFNNGSSSGINTAGKTAIEILSTTDIPVDLRWTSTCTMDKTAFIIVKVVFNSNSGLTSMPTITSKMTNTLTKPGDVLLDYMTNERYGCGIPVASVDTGSLTDLNTYSDQTITYYTYPYTGATTTQPRYRINGPMITGNECMTNLTQLTDGCDSWLKFNEIESQWSVVINKAYDQSPGALTTADLYHVTDDVLIGGIDINPTDLNSTYNAVELQYPDTNIKDATGYQYISLWETEPEVLSPNEPFNQQTITLPVVNNAVQALYLGSRRLYQGREDLTINFMLDYSGIQIEAGDVIRISSEVYGWNAPVFPDGKLFRVLQVQEAKLAEGSLGANIVASEYNETVYVDDVIMDYIPSENSGLADPAIIGTPAAPNVYTSALTEGNVASFWVQAVVPTVGQVLYMDFFYGSTSTVADHKLYRTISLASGDPSTAGSTVYINITSFDPGIWYWSVRARNNIAAKSSAASTGYAWGGPSVTDYAAVASGGFNSSGTTVTGPTGCVASLGLAPGLVVKITLGVGEFVVPTIISSIVDGESFIVSNTPVTPLVDATILFSAGGINSNAIVPAAVDTTKITPYNPYTGTGGLNINVINPNSMSVSRPIGGTNFSITNPTFTLPVSVLSTSTRNIPVYIPGTTVSSTVYYPFFQGTSSTADGYQANSTAPMTPANSQGLLVNDSYHNWYVLVYDLFAAGTVTSREVYESNFGATLVSDADATIQICAGAAETGFTDWLVFTEKLQTHELKANKPIVIAFSQTWIKAYPIGGSSYIGGALICRNMTAGSNVTLISGSLASSALPNPYTG